VLEGWAFDVCDVDRAARAVAGTSDGVQTLRPLVQMSVSGADARGGEDNTKGEAR
jgi:hypothetical protein